jgi:hypothetical protein
MNTSALPFALLVALAAACSGQQTAGTPTTAPAPTSVAPAPPAGTTPTTASVSPVTTATAPAPAGTKPDIHRVDFRNFTYPANTCAIAGFPPAPDGDGYPLRDARWNGQGNEYVAVERDVVYGDVTGDGRDDAVVTVTCSSGVGSGTNTHPWVFTPDASAPAGARQLAFPGLTDPTLRQLGLAGAHTRGGVAEVGDGVLTITWGVFTPDDLPIAPSKLVTTRQRWDGGAWHDATAPTVRDRPPGE